MNKKDEILAFATTWIDLESIMLSETSQMEKDKNCIISTHVEYKTEKDKILRTAKGKSPAEKNFSRPSHLKPWKSEANGTCLKC